MRGGARPGAGRPKGSQSDVPKFEPTSPEGELPLGYILRIMRDGNIDPKRRDAMAKAALPYFYGRLQQASYHPADPNAPSQNTPFEGLFHMLL